MRKMLFLLSALTLVFLAVLVWQGTTYLRLLNQARDLETAQEATIKENRRLESSIAVLTNRAWAETAAASIGLVKADPSQRIRIVVDGEAVER